MARYFVEFKPNSSLASKLMVFTGMTEQQVRNEVNREYGKAVQRIYSEQDIAQILPNVYNCKEHWVTFGSHCVYTEQDCNGNSTGTIEYPKSKNVKPYKEHEVSLKDITEWFKTAKPNPTQTDLFTQLGAMYEEVTESIVALSNEIIISDLDSQEADLHNKLQKAQLALQALSQAMYTHKGFNLSERTKVDLLDALADITVTTVGSAQYAGFKFDEALTEVNKSNYSKFEDGKPLFNGNGKIIKGKDYFKPNLTELV